MSAIAGTAPSGSSGLLKAALDRLAAVPEKLHGGLGYHRGPVLVNQLGYQVFRTVYKNVGWHLRDQPAEVDAEARPYVEELDRLGCVKIPDFFPADVWEKIKLEHERGLRELPYVPYMVEDNGVEETMLQLEGRQSDFPTLWPGLVNHPLIRKIVAGALRRPVTVRPRLWLRRSRKLDTPIKPFGPGHIVGANHAHADMHYPTFKAFLYLNDVDESNGAFQFALGSHRFTFARVAYEYDASVRVARGRRSGNWERASYALVRLPTPVQAERLGLPCQPITGRANTLILANVQGFHRQGEFQPGTARELACLCFRSSEPGGSALVAND